MNGIRALRRVTKCVSVLPFSALCHMDTREVGSGRSPEPDHAGSLIFDFEPHTEVRKAFLLFITQPVSGTLLQQPE